MKAVPRSSYISRVVELSPPLADVAFDQHVQRVGGNVDVPSGTFLIVRMLHAPESTPEVLRALWRAPGRLRPRAFGPSISVELELMPWSRTHTEIGLRYTGRGRLGPLAASRYFRVGAEVVEAVVAELATGRIPAPSAEDHDMRAA